jgi:hypothetical protein
MGNIAWDFIVLAIAAGFFALSFGMVKVFEWLQEE